MPSNGRLCTIPGCDKKLCARGWCGKHYRRWRLYGDPLTKLRSWDPAGTPCKHNGCDRTKTGGGRGWCTLHYERWMRGGDEALDRQRKMAEPSYISNTGYRMIHVGPGKYVQEHRLVMEGVLDRPLDRSENVHHRNGDKLDNRPENLELWAVMQPSGQRVSDLLEFARSVIDKYGDLPKEAL